MLACWDGSAATIGIYPQSTVTFILTMSGDRSYYIPRSNILST